MEDLKKIYEQEIKLLQLFQNTIFYGLEFDNVNYEIKNAHNFMQKKILKKLKDGIEINCKETIYKKWIEKYLEIKIKINKKDYDAYKIIINTERIKLIHEKYESNKKTILSKQFGLNGYIIYTYNDNKNNYIIHQNVNNLLQYLENFNEDIYCNIFKFENENIKYISKFPYNFVYESVINCSVFNEEDLFELFAQENKKRKSTNSEELKVKKDTKKNIENNISKIKLVYDNTKDLYNNMIDVILEFPQIDEIIQKGTKIVDELDSKENENYNYENKAANEITELEILKSQRLELIEIKKTTDEIINKLQNILIN